MSGAKNSQVSRRYAEALFAAVSPADRALVLDEFQDVLTVLSDPQICEVFNHPRTSRTNKNELIRLMKRSKTMENFLLLIVEKSREQYLPAIRLHFEQQVLKAKQTTLAEVISAVPLTPETLQELTKKLGKLTQKTVLISSKVDPQIVGGMIVKVDGKVIDGSVSHTLKQFQRALSQ